MATPTDHTYRRQGLTPSPTTDAPSTPEHKSRTSTFDEKDSISKKDRDAPVGHTTAILDDKYDHDLGQNGEVDDLYNGTNGTEKVIESADDVATRLVSLDDDPTLPVWTLRMWVLGLGMTAFAAVLGQLFYFRPQTVAVSQLFIQVLAYIFGKAISTLLPDTSKSTNPWIRWLNPGAFNIKEHVCIVVMSATATESALAISVFAADDLFYGIQVSYVNGLFALLGSQAFGYGIAGLLRSFLVFPTYIVFPNLLPQVNLFDTLHRDKNVTAQAKRKRIFWVVFLSIFVWEWFPEFIAPTLTGISIFCLANRKSLWFTRIFGGANGNEGLGMFSICLDWNYIGSGGGSIGALFTPFTTQISLYVGVAICCITFCAAYVNNVWHAQNFPFLSQEIFYENGTVYDQKLILNPDQSVNDTLLLEQGIPWYATSNAIYLLGDNMAIGATFMHVGLWFGPQIVKAFKEYMSGSQKDPHYQKMLVYNEVPMWWYGVTLFISFVCAMTTCYTGHSHLSWWQLIVALIVAAFAFPFVTVVYAVTGFACNVQQLAEMIGAGLAPRNPQAIMYFTLYGSNTVLQARGLTRDLKLGQYTKVPPRCTFMAQLVGTVIGALLQLVIMRSVINSHRDLLTSVQGSNIWSGQQVQSFNSNAITWALAKEMYGPSSPYFVIPMGILIGFFVPIPFWVLYKIAPQFRSDAVVTPILCWTIGYLCVGINSSIMMTMLIAIFSQFYLRRYRPAWFRKYNFLVSAALDGGAQLFSFLASFTLFGAAGKAQNFQRGLSTPIQLCNTPTTVTWIQLLQIECLQEF